MNYISLLGAFQALIILGIFGVFSAPKPIDSDRILNWLVACIFTHLTGSFIMNKAFPDAEIHNGYVTFISLLYAPLLWLYALKLQQGRKLPGIKVFLLFVPAGIAAIAYFIIGGYVITHGGKTPVFIAVYNNAVGYFSLVSYSFYGIKSLNISQRLPGLSLSGKQLIRLIAIIFMGVVALALILSVGSGMFPHEISYADIHLWIRIVSYTTLLIICLAIGRVKILSIYYHHMETAASGNLALSGSSLAHLIQDEKDFIVPALMEYPLVKDGEQRVENAAIASIEMPSAETVLQNRQKKSGLADELQADIIEKVNHQMMVEKLYTDPDLSLDRLAVLIKVPRHHLSESLNKYLGKSFYQYVNEYRINQVVEEMERARQNNTVPNILSVAFEAGFHSKSSFNQYFKKTTGLTPSAYLKNGA
ncbi:AraC-like DNA-binding protein [Chitinophaga polysaccharea]|uniref:AraC-like DNA-binding protein n=1 Tax=Chitinophaga polysaccharea TaxID=1293035 RepID=A0A561PPA4_9BACT|nr:helix-turn-helix domain-containing protein [Chitinophaga polysaccharea]TWF39944.1 AraC-like DNA-binding protein [Chitinophaga polysaccharea]